MLELEANDNLHDELEGLLLSSTINDPVTVSRRTLSRALARYISGELEQSELIVWADLIECNELVRYEQHFEQLIASIIFFIATPEVNGPLTSDLSREYLKKLSSQPVGQIEPKA